jgi:hypothetical protein
MNSLKKLAHIADKFERKLSRAQQAGAPLPTMESNQRPVIMDAFFGPNGEERFMKQINNPGSSFQQAAGDVQGKISINVKVDSGSKDATFVVSPNVPKLQSALVKDFAAVFKADPKSMFQQRLAKSEVRPANVSGTTNLVTM